MISGTNYSPAGDKSRSIKTVSHALHGNPPNEARAAGGEIKVNVGG
jgi:hypothetical protein